MNDYDDFIMNLGEQEKKMVEKPDYEKSWKERATDNWNFVKSLTDWFRLPLNILISIILLIEAVLMYDSIYRLTGNFFVSVFSPVFSSVGIIAFEVARERTKNTPTQTEIASRQRNMHTIASIVLLVTNFAVETLTNSFKIKVDGAIWIIFGIIGIMALVDLFSYFSFADNDRETANRKKFETKSELLLAETTEKRMDAFAKAEQIKADALIKFWEENSPILAEKVGKLEAARTIKETYTKAGLSEEEVDKLLGIISTPNNKHQTQEQNNIQNNTQSQSQQITPHPQPIQSEFRQKRKYTRRTPQIEQDLSILDKKVSSEIPSPVENNPVTQDEENVNFTNGEHDSDGW